MIKQMPVFILFIVALNACTKLSSKTAVNTQGSLTVVSNAVNYTHVLKNITLNSPTASATPVGLANPSATPSTTSALALSLAVDVSQSNFSPLTNFCGTGGTNPCVCELDWTQINTVGGGNTGVPRTKRVPVTQVQSGLVVCSLDQNFWAQIPSGTTVTMKIVPTSNNTTGLAVQSLGFKVGTSTSANGDFYDNTLTPFRNIYRYSCFSKWQNSFEILNQYQPRTTTGANGTSSTSNVLLSSMFCSGAPNTSPTNQCQTPRNGYSAQSYYRNLFIPSDQVGNINSTNGSYDCPKVLESVRFSAGQSIPSSEQSNYWPLDTTFALATEYSSSWNVGVRSGTILFKNGDPNSVSTACTNENVSKRLNERGIVIKCMGYAQAPNPDGTCAAITDSKGNSRQLVRLRRFRVIYPTTFQANGQVQSGPTEADEVYIPDRLVLNAATGAPTGSMIYGPKPCNFSWFDHEGVVNRDGVADFGSKIQSASPAPNPGQYARPAYVSTTKFYNHNNLTLVNPDGLLFPRFDRDGTLGSSSGPVCAATLPFIDSTLGAPSAMQLLTTHQNRGDHIALGNRIQNLSEVYVRPIDPWTPTYVEDTSFQACAPVSDPYYEPPLHFYKKDSNTIAWCAEAYPTQNPYWTDLNAKKIPTNGLLSGIVVSYTPAPGATPSSPVRTVAPVQNYTSHDTSYPNPSGGTLDSLNSCSGTLAATICSASLGTTAGTDYSSCLAYLGSGGLTRTTCDRTVVFDSNQAFRGFPLLAADTDIEDMLNNDLNHNRGFSCQYSVHANPAKIGAAVPTSGCCGMINGTPVLNSLLNAQGVAVGHLEPYVNSNNSSNRFCGNPVDTQ